MRRVLRVIVDVVFAWLTDASIDCQFQCSLAAVNTVDKFNRGQKISCMSRDSAALNATQQSRPRQHLVSYSWLERLPSRSCEVDPLWEITVRGRESSESDVIREVVNCAISGGVRFSPPGWSPPRCTTRNTSLWPPYVIGGPLYFCPVVSFLPSLRSPYVIGRPYIFSSCNYGRPM